MRSPILKKILVLAAICGGLLPFQNCIFSNMVKIGGTASNPSQSSIPTIGSAESNGNGYDGKIFTNRGECGNELFGVQSAIRISTDGKKIERVVKNCLPVNNIPVPPASLTMATASTFVLDGNVHNYEFETPPRLAGKVVVWNKGAAGGYDRLVFDDGINLKALKSEDNFLKIDFLLQNSSSSTPFISQQDGYKLVAIGRFGFLPQTNFVFRKDNTLAYRGVTLAGAISNLLNPLDIFNDTLTSEMQVVGIAPYVPNNIEELGGGNIILQALFGGMDQMVLRDRVGFKIVSTNLMMPGEINDFKYVYTQTQNTAVVQETDSGFAFLGMGRFSPGSTFQPIRRVDDALQLPVGDAKVLSLPSAGSGPIVLESKGQPVLVMRRNQKVVAIANIEGDELSEIIFEENNTLYMLRHTGPNKLGSVTLGNLVNPLDALPTTPVATNRPVSQSEIPTCASVNTEIDRIAPMIAAYYATQGAGDNFSKAMAFAGGAPQTYISPNVSPGMPQGPGVTHTLGGRTILASDFYYAMDAFSIVRFALQEFREPALDPIYVGRSSVESAFNSYVQYFKAMPKFAGPSGMQLVGSPERSMGMPDVQKLEEDLANLKSGTCSAN